MGEEHQSTEQRATDAASPVARVKQEIRAFVAAIQQQDTVRWKAFCDYTDFLTFERDFHVQPNPPDRAGLSYPELRLGLISEVIRQRINELPGYKREYEHVAQLVEKLNAARDEEDPHGDKLSNPSDLLFSTVEFVTATKEQRLHTFT